MKPLQIVHLGKYYPPAPGGIETHTRTLCEGLAARGHAVRVLVVNHATAAGRDATFEPATPTPDAVERVGPVEVWRAGRVASLARLDFAPSVPQFLRRLARAAPDVWHLHTPNITMMLAALANRAVRPLVITHHSDIIHQRRLKHAVRPFELALYGRAARLLPTSPPYAAGSAVLARFPGRVEALPLGLDLAPFADPSVEALAHAAELRARHPGPLWVTAGRLVYYKALDVALAALRDLPGTLVVTGTGPMLAAWQAKANELGVAGRVVWRGRAADFELVGAYHAAAAHLFPSNARSEGFGLVQVEAMASGCPTVNAAVPDSGVPWVCRDGVAGLTVPVDDAPALAAAARRILNEPGLRERLSGGGKAEAQARFRTEVMVDNCLAVYGRVVAETRAGVAA